MDVVNGVSTASGASAAYESYAVRAHEISSGKKSAEFNSPAILQIGQKMLNNVAASEAARSDLQNGVSFAQTVQSSLGAVNDTLSSIRSLSVRANDGTLNQQDRDAINAEAQQYLQQLQQWNQTSSYNGVKYLQGGSYAVAANQDGDTLTLDTPDTSLASLGLANMDLSTPAGAVNALKAVDKAAAEVGDSQVVLGSEQKVLEEAHDAQLQYEGNMLEAGSSMVDTDIASAVLKSTIDLIQGNASFAVQAQGATMDMSVLSLLSNTQSSFRRAA